MKVQIEGALMNLELTVKCGACGAGLSATCNSKEGRLVVEPCERCLQAAKKGKSGKRFSASPQNGVRQPSDTVRQFVEQQMSAIYAERDSKLYLRMIAAIRDTRMLIKCAECGSYKQPHFVNFELSEVCEDCLQNGQKAGGE